MGGCGNVNSCHLCCYYLLLKILIGIICTEERDKFEQLWFGKLAFGIYSSSIKYCDIYALEGGNHIAARFEQIWCPVYVERSGSSV